MDGSDGIMSGRRKYALNRWRRCWAYIALKHEREEARRFTVSRWKQLAVLNLVKPVSNSIPHFKMQTYNGTMALT